MKRRRTQRKPAQRQGVGEFRFHDRQSVKKRRRYRNLMRQGVLVLLCAVIVLSASMVVGIVVRSVRTRRLSRELAERRDQMEPAVLSAETPQPTTPDVQEAVFLDVSEPEPEEESSPTMEPAPTADASKQQNSFHRILGQALLNSELYEGGQIISCVISTIIWNMLWHENSCALTNREINDKI